MIPVGQALEHLFALCAQMPTEHVPLEAANGRVLAQDVAANRTQPPFAASSMDGYALCRAEVEADAMFKLIGEAAAGHPFTGKLGAGQAVRIFTGAPVPEGADIVVIQEQVTRRGTLITLDRGVDQKSNIRPAGADFNNGDVMLRAPRHLGPNDIALLAAMNVAMVPVSRKPRVAILATGDELVMPGETPSNAQIVASNSFGLAAMLENLGAEARMLPIARDTPTSLATAFDLAKGADLLITIGGASVGDHDLVAATAAKLGMEQAFYKVAMRPGKPLMAGRLGPMCMIGLPGNPVSAMVCGTVFVTPMIRAMQGFAKSAAPRLSAPLCAPLAQNGPREHYMRGTVSVSGITPLDRQDSSLLSVLAQAEALIIRPPNDPHREIGEQVPYIAL